jgi:hypothetical protein
VAETEQPAEVKLQAFVPPWTREFIIGSIRKSTPPAVDISERAREFMEQLEEEEEAVQRQD